MTTTRIGAVTIETLPTAFLHFLEACEIYCVAGCCGVGAFSFEAPVVRDAANKIGTDEVAEGILMLLAQIDGLSAPTIIIERVNQYADRRDYADFLRSILMIIKPCDSA